MSMLVYLNGEYLPAEKAMVSPLDRGFTFGDGVYEILPVAFNKPLYLDAHIDRLNTSLAAIHMLPPHTHAEWKGIVTRLIQENAAPNQWIYLQVTRGLQLMREHTIPKDTTPTIFAISYPQAFRSKEEQAKGIKAIGVTDIRWKYCNIKTTARLAYVLMYEEAKRAHVDEAIIIHNGFALEGTISNLFMVKDGILITPPKSSFLLSGITRDRILALAKANQIPHYEQKIPEQDLLTADELWITSSTRGVIPILEWNGNPVGRGIAGPLWNTMWDYYAEDMAQHALQC